MRFIGVDLAWADSAVANETGVVALDEDGTIVAAGWPADVAPTTAWLEANAGEEAIAFIDAPFVVLNDRKQRLCEKQVGQRYGRWKVSANSTNRASPRLAGVQLREVLEQRGWKYDDGVGGGPPDDGRSVSECYPSTALVGAAEFGYQKERPLYKRKPRGLSATQWRPLRAAGCDELIDACLAAWTAALWWSGSLERVQVLGVDDPLVDALGTRATIIAPARAEQRLSGIAGL